MHRKLIVLGPSLAILATMIWLVGPSSRSISKIEADNRDWADDSRFDFEALVPYMTRDELVAHRQWYRDFGQKDRAEYVETFSLKEIANDFPVRAGMTISEMDDAIAQNDRKFQASEFEQNLQMYNLVLRQRRINDGSGWVFYWVNFKHVFFCDIVIENSKVQSVWVMPGNYEWLTQVFYRISGRGAHRVSGRVWGS